MLELGGKIFRINSLQLVCIVLCFVMAVLAKSLAINTAGLSISDFISITIQQIFENHHTFSAIINIWLPIGLYAISSLLLLWMGITNIATLPKENKINTYLKVGLGVLQVGFFGLFVFEGGKLFIYVAALSFVCVFVFACFVSLFSSDRES